MSYAWVSNAIALVTEAGQRVQLTGDSLSIPPDAPLALQVAWDDNVGATSTDWFAAPPGAFLRAPRHFVGLRFRVRPGLMQAPTTDAPLLLPTTPALQRLQTYFTALRDYRFMVTTAPISGSDRRPPVGAATTSAAGVNAFLDSVGAASFGYFHLASYFSAAALSGADWVQLRFEGPLARVATATTPRLGLVYNGGYTAVFGGSQDADPALIANRVITASGLFTIRGPFDIYSSVVIQAINHVVGGADNMQLSFAPRLGVGEPPHDSAFFRLNQNAPIAPGVGLSYTWYMYADSPTLRREPLASISHTQSAHAAGNISFSSELFQAFLVQSLAGPVGNGTSLNSAIASSPIGAYSLFYGNPTALTISTLDLRLGKR